MSTHVSIVGAGVAGLSCATELVARGVNVTIYDRAEAIGPASCSWYAGGMLAPWCERENAEEHVITLGAMAADWWDINTGLVSRNGSLVVAQGRDRAELSRFAARTSNFEKLDADAISTLEPDLAGRFQRALHFTDEAHLDPRKAVEQLAKRLEQNGATFQMGEEVNISGLARNGAVIDARGFAARDTLTDLRGVKGEMLLVHCRDMKLSRPVRLLHPRIPLYIVPREDNVFMVGATMIESADGNRMSVRSVLELLGSAYALHPAFGEAEILETGVDTRPAYPDNLPRITRSGNIISINGMYRHGFLLSPAIARQAADLILSENSNREITHAHHT